MNERRNEALRPCVCSFAYMVLLLDLIRKTLGCWDTVVFTQDDTSGDNIFACSIFSKPTGLVTTENCVVK